MIRAAAALKLARDILEPFIERQMVNETSVQMAARLVVLAVQQDELEQECERKESVLKLLGGNDGHVL